MFKFRFGDTPTPANTRPESSTKTAGPVSKTRAYPVQITNDVSPNGEIDVLGVGPCLTLRKSTANAPASLAKNGADVVSGVYEGGFKLWECAVDLVRYVHKNSASFSSDINVLEIGAGHALPGIVAAHAGARVVLHDYNEEVLRLCTAPNVALNNVNHVTYVAGDWESLPEVVGREQFDVVLSAETVYNADAVPSLSTAILDTLKPGGYALVAGKTYYFGVGVGGGMPAFRSVIADIAKQRGIAINVSVVEELRDGKSNVREITRIGKLKS